MSIYICSESEELLTSEAVEKKKKNKPTHITVTKMKNVEGKNRNVDRCTCAIIAFRAL